MKTDKTKNLIIPTWNARRFMAPKFRTKHNDSGTVVLPTPNKEGLFHFPDGEIYLRLPGIGDAKNIIVVHAGYPNPNEGLIELYMMLDIIRRYAPQARLTVVFTIFPYARQDKIRAEGELNTAEVMIQKLIRFYGVSKIIAFDAHFDGEPWVNEYPFMNVTAVDLLTAAARVKHPDMVLVAPDAGSSRRAHIKGATKKRANSFDVSLDLGSVRMKGLTIGTVDDMLSTGTTMVKFVEAARAKGAKRVFGLVTHGINQLGLDRVISAYDGLFVTDTVNCPEANVTIVPRLWNIIRKEFAYEE